MLLLGACEEVVAEQLRAEFGMAAGDAVAGVLPVLLGEREQVCREQDSRKSRHEAREKRGCVLFLVEAEIEHAYVGAGVRGEDEVLAAACGVGAREQHGALIGCGVLLDDEGFKLLDALVDKESVYPGDCQYGGV